MKFTIPFIAAMATLASAAPTELAKRKHLLDGSGQGTYYNTGLGACGYTNNDSQWVVALAPGDFNGGSRCGDAISIWYGGKQVWAQVVDLCTGCGTGSIDMSPSLFQQFADLGVGRLYGMTWWINA